MSTNNDKEGQFKKALQTAVRNLKPGESIYLLASARTFGLGRIDAKRAVVEVLQDKTSAPRARHGGFTVLQFRTGEYAIGLLPPTKEGEPKNVSSN